MAMPDELISCLGGAPGVHRLECHVNAQVSQARVAEIELQNGLTSCVCCAAITLHCGIWQSLDVKQFQS